MPLKKRSASKTSISNLAESEPWMKVQTKVFTNWLNDQLKNTTAKRSVVNLSKDLEDGLILIELLESLSRKKVHGKVNQKPKRSAHYAHNLSLAFSFMKDVEQLPIINISQSQIQEGNTTQILNLIWHIIMRYQITESKNGAKSLLLDWVRRCLPEKTINNFTTDWIDGFLLSSLVNFCDSSLIIDHLWLDSNSLENIENALNMAEEYLGIPQLLQPQDFLIEKPDERSIMTYLSYFCNGPESPGQKKLLNWIQDQTNDETILNFNNVWVDGNKLGLLISVVSSGEFEFSENETETQEEAVDNCRLMLEVADKLLGVDMIMTPEEFADRSFNSLVRMMYLLQFYFSTVEARVHELHIPEEPGVGAAVWLDVFLPDGSTSIINSNVSGKVVGEVPVKVELLEDGKHRIQFDAEIQDIYSLNVSVGGTRIKGSPFTIDLTDPDPNSVKVTNTIFPKKSGIPVIMTVKATDSSHGELRGTAMGNVCGDVPFLKEIDSPTSYKISFIPWQADTYVVDIRLDGRHIKGSPYTFDLTNLIQPEMVSIRKPEKKEVGEPVVVPIDARAGGDGKVTVKCSGEKAGEVETFLNEPQNPTEITFTPPIEDIYHMSVFFDNSEVMGSPLKINLYPSSADATKVRLSHPPSNSVSAGKEVRIGFDTSDAGVGEITASCAGQNIGDVKVEVIQGENSCEIVFVPPKGDIYDITVLWSDTPVPGSPFKMNLIPKDLSDPRKCKVIGFPEVSTLLLINEAVEFKVDTTNAGRGYLDVVIEIENEDEDANEDDRISVVSTGTRGSEYSNMMDVEMEDEELEPIHEEEDDDGDVKDFENSEKKTGEEGITEVQKDDEIELPTTVKEEGDVSVTNEAIGKEEKEEIPVAGLEGGVDTEDSLDIQRFLANADLEDEVQAAPTLNIVKNEENPKIYNITFMPVQKGNHSINIYWADQPILDSNLSLNIAAPQVVHFNNPISVPVKTKYKRKNLKVQIHKRDATSVHQHVKMDKIKTGDYLLIFTPNQPGVYLMHVTAKNKPIKGSPFIISYVQPDIPKDIDVRVTNLQSSVYVGERVNFVIESKGDNLLPDELSVIRRPSLINPELDPSKENFTDVHLQRNKDGSLTAEYTPSDAGEELLEVRVGNKAVRGSPFKVSVKTKKAKKDDIFGLQLDEYKFIVGEPNNLKLFCKELGEGDVQVLCKPSTHADITITPDDSEEKVYWVEIKPKKSGKANLFVRYAGGEIFGSPFNVNFLARGNAKKCMLLTTTDCIHDPSDIEKVFCVTTKGAGKGKVTATMKRLLSGKHINVRVDLHSKHHYHLKFVPTEGLNYMLSVRFDDIDIKGSPYKILLGNPSQCKVEGEGLINPWSGKLNKFYVDSESAGPGELSVVIEGDEEDVFDKQTIKLKSNILRLEEFKYEVSYKPDVPGVYWVDAKWNDVSIPGSPFKIICKKPLSSNQLSIKDLVSITHHGKRAEMIVQVDQVIEESDKLTVVMLYQNSVKYPGEVTRRDDQSYIISFQPPELGEYSVYVLWDEQHISSSPFKIEDLPPPSPSDFSVEAAEGDQGEIAVNVIGPVFSYKYGELTASFCHASTNISDDVPVNINPLSDTDCAVNFKPERGGEYILSLYYDKEHIVGSPFTVISTDASQCRSKGKGLSIARINHNNKFAVFTENAGPGELRVEIEGEVENEGGVVIDPEIKTLNNTRYDISYSPQLPGQYKISVFWDTENIPESPFEVNCCDPSRYSLVNPPKEGALGIPIKIGIKESSPAPSFEQLEVFTFGKDRMAHKGEINKGDDGYYLGTVQPPELGKYLVHVRCNSYDVEGSPFKIKNMPAPIPEKVVVSGSGIKDGVIGQRGLFQIDISEAGHGFISLRVQGPKGGFQINISHSKEDDHLVLAEYNPIHSGSYSIDVLWSGIRVPNSPFAVNIIDGEHVQNRNATTQSAAVEAE